MESLLGYAQSDCNVARDHYINQNSSMVPVLVRIRGISPFAGLNASPIETIGGNPEKVADYDPLEMRIARLTHRVNNEGQRVNFFDAFITLGRAANNDLLTSNSAVSTAHAFFYVENGTVYIEDRESSNGSALIDGFRTPLQPKVKTSLKNGVTIETGGEETGDRYIFFSDPGDLYDFIKRQVARTKDR